MSRSPVRRSPYRTRGAVAVFAAVAMVAAVIALALAIDVGRLFFAQRDLQRMANLAALDATRAAGRCGAPVADPLAAAQADALASVLANGGRADLLAPGAVELGRRTDDGDLWVFQPAAANDGFDSVRVRLKTLAPARVVPGFTGAERLTLTATAAAYRSASAPFYVTPAIASLSTPPLAGPIGAGFPPSGFVIGGANGVEGTVELGQLSAEVGALSPEQFLNTRLTLNDLLNALANMVDATGNTALRNTLDAAASTAGNLGLSPGAIINVPPGAQGAVAGALLDVGTIATAAAESANGQNLLNIPIPIGIPGAPAAGTATVRVIEPPQSGTGEPGSEAQSAQALFQLSLPGPAVMGSPVHLDLFLEGAAGRATVRSIDCPSYADPVARAHFDGHADLSRLGIGHYDDLRSAHPQVQPSVLLQVNLLGTPVRVLATGSVPIGNVQDVSLTFDSQHEFPYRQGFGVPASDALRSAAADLSGHLQLSIEPANVLQNPLLRGPAQALLAQLQPAVDQLLRQAGINAADALTRQLGVSLGETQVNVLALNAGPPVLYTH